MGASAEKTHGAKRRSWLQFSLRSLLALITLAAVLLGWYAFHARRAQRQQAAVESIRLLGGSVVYEHEDGEFDPATMRRLQAPPGPTWGRKWFGVDFYRHLKIVSLNEAGQPVDDKMPPLPDEVLANLVGNAHLTKQVREDYISAMRARAGRAHDIDRHPLTDDDLAPIAADLAVLPQLRELKLWGNDQVTLEACPEIGWLTQLTTLNLRGTATTDAGISHLASLDGLRGLDVGHTQITDAGMATIGRLMALETLTLSGAKITDAGVAHLRVLRELRTLSLVLTGVTDAGVSHLSGLAKLERLDLSHTSVTDDGVGRLKALSNLTWLNLHGTQISGQALDPLTAQTKLQHLDVRQSALTDDDVRTLAEQLPNTKIAF